MGGEIHGQVRQQRIGTRGLGEADIHRTDLTSRGMVIHPATAGVGKQLMAVADTQHRQVGSNGLAQPLRCRVVPGSTVCDHGRRSGDNHTGHGGRIRQHFTFVHSLDLNLIGSYLQLPDDPVVG